MKRLFYSMVFIISAFSFNNYAFSGISISGSNFAELEASIKEFEAIVSAAKGENNEVPQEVELTRIEGCLKKIGSGFDRAFKVIKNNQRTIKLGAVAGAVVYGKYVDPDFFPELLNKTSKEVTKLATRFTNAILDGAASGVWSSKGFFTKIGMTVAFYSAITTAITIGVKGATEYFVKFLGKSAEKRAGKAN